MNEISSAILVAWSPMRSMFFKAKDKCMAGTAIFYHYSFDLEVA